MTDPLTVGSSWVAARRVGAVLWSTFIEDRRVQLGKDALRLSLLEDLLPWTLPGAGSEISFVISDTEVPRTMR